MWDLALMTIFINHPLYVGFFSSSQYGTGVLHILFGNSKKSAFIGFIDKVKSKVDGWRAKTLLRLADWC
jgi:hypothetical protein